MSFLPFTKRLFAIFVSFALLSTPALTAMAATNHTYAFNVLTTDQYDTTGISFTDSNAAVSWYHPDWGYRQKITISKDFIGEELTDFPVLIRLDNHALTGARDDRHDLVFTTSDGITKLAHEREDKYNIWVKVPKLTPTSTTTLYLYYGNSAVAADQQNVSGVWTNGYGFVAHLNQHPEGAVIDSRNGYVGASNGGMNREDSLREGQIDQAFKFDGVNDYVAFAGSENANTKQAPFTISAWVKPGATQANYSGIVTKDSGAITSPAHQGFAFHIMANGTTRLYSNNGLGSVVDFRSTTAVNDNEWHYVTATYTGSEILLGIDGAVDASRSWTNYAAATSRSLFIGVDSTQGIEFNGLIDEARVSQVSRTNSWIRAEYANQANVENFLTISSDIEAHPTTTSTDATATTAATVFLKPDYALSYTSLSAFTVNASPTVTFQLSPDAGKTWYFYTAEGWKPANPVNPVHRSSANDISGHINSFPQIGTLLWRAYLPADTTLDDVRVTYTGSGIGKTATFSQSTAATRLLSHLSSLFTLVHQRDITPAEKTYWTNRITNGDKTTLPELFGAMQWQLLFGGGAL